MTPPTARRSAGHGDCSTWTGHASSRRDRHSSSDHDRLVQAAGGAENASAGVRHPRASSVPFGAVNNGRARHPESMPTSTTPTRHEGQSPFGSPRPLDSRDQSASSVLVTHPARRPQADGRGLPFCPAPLSGPHRIRSRRFPPALPPGRCAQGRPAASMRTTAEALLCPTLPLRPTSPLEACTPARPVALRHPCPIRPRRTGHQRSCTAYMDTADLSTRGKIHGKQ